jgi:hypothetical protein
MLKIIGKCQNISENVKNIGKCRKYVFAENFNQISFRITSKGCRLNSTAKKVVMEFFWSQKSGLFQPCKLSTAERKAERAEMPDFSCYNIP